MNDVTRTSKERVAPLVTALIQAVKMERDEFHERCNNSYSTDALMLCKERVALCKAAVLAAMEPEVKDIEEEYSEHQIAIRDEQIEQLQNANESLQARIDALMLEFCPGEMSISQRVAWQASQERAAPEPCVCQHCFAVHKTPGTECSVEDCPCGYYRASQPPRSEPPVGDQRLEDLILRESGSDIEPLLCELKARRASQPQATAREPDGYAYRYHDARGDVIRFNGGQQVNGGGPFEAVPYWLGNAPSQPPSEYPEELFDGYAVQQELTEQERERTSTENVIDVLDALVRLMRKRRASQTKCEGPK